MVIARPAQIIQGSKTKKAECVDLMTALTLKYPSLTEHAKHVMNTQEIKVTILVEVTNARRDKYCLLMVLVKSAVTMSMLMKPRRHVRQHVKLER